MKRQRIRARVLHMMWLCRCFMMGVGNWRGVMGATVAHYMKGIPQILLERQTLKKL